MARVRYNRTMAHIETIMAAANGATDRMELLKERASHPQNKQLIEWVLIRLAMIEQEARQLRHEQSEIEEELLQLRQERSR